MISALSLSLLLLFPQGGIIPVRRALGVSACTIPDETNTFLSVWFMEEATGVDRANSSTRCAGDDCEWELSGDPAQDGTIFVEGSYSVHFVEADGDEFNCTRNNPGCDELAFNGSVTVGFWMQVDDGAENMNIFDSLNTNEGIEFDYGFDEKMRCYIGNGTGSPVVTSSAFGVADTWFHVVCRHTGGATDEVTIFIDGEEDTTPVPAADMADLDSDDIYVSNPGRFDGHLDEMFIQDDALSDAEICYLCSCGVANFRGCTASGADPSGFDDPGVNVSACGSCTLPANACDPIS